MGSFQLPSQPPFQNLSRRNSQLSLGSTDDRSPRLRSRRSDLGESPRSPSTYGSRSRAPSTSRGSSRPPSSRALSPSPSLDRGRRSDYEAPSPPRGIPLRSSSMHHSCRRPYSAIFSPTTPESPSLNAAVHSTHPNTPTPGSRRRTVDWKAGTPGSSPAWALHRSATSAADGAISGHSMPSHRHSMLILDDSSIPLGLAPSPLPPMPEYEGGGDGFFNVDGAAAAAAAAGITSTPGTPRTRAGSMVSSVGQSDADDDDDSRSSPRGGDVSSVGSMSTYPSLGLSREGSLKLKADDKLRQGDEVDQVEEVEQGDKISQDDMTSPSQDDTAPIGLAPVPEEILSDDEVPPKKLVMDAPVEQIKQQAPQPSSPPSDTTTTTTPAAAATAATVTTTANSKTNKNNNSLPLMTSALVVIIAIILGCLISTAVLTTDPVPLTAISAPVSLVASTTYHRLMARRSSPLEQRPHLYYPGLNTTAAISALLPSSDSKSDSEQQLSLLSDSLAQTASLTREYESRIFWLENLVRFYQSPDSFNSNSSSLGSTWLAEAESRLTGSSSSDNNNNDNNLHLRTQAALETLYSRYETVCGGGESELQQGDICEILSGGSVAGAGGILPAWKTCVDRLPFEMERSEVWKPLFLGGVEKKKPKQGKVWEYGERCVSVDVGTGIGEEEAGAATTASTTVVVTKGSAAHRLEVLRSEWERLRSVREQKKKQEDEAKQEVEEETKKASIGELGQKALSWGVWKVRRVSVWMEFGV